MELKEIKKTTIGGQALMEGLMMIGPDKTAMAVRLADGAIHCEEKASRRYGTFGKLPFARGCVRLIGQLAVGMKALTRSADLSELTSVQLNKGAGEEIADAEGWQTLLTTEPDPEKIPPVMDQEVKKADGGDVQPENADSTEAQGEEAQFATVDSTELGTDASAASSAVVSTDPSASATVSTAAGGSSSGSSAPASGEKKTSQASYTLAIVLGIVLGIGIFVFLPNLITTGISYLTGYHKDVGDHALVFNLVEGVIRILILLGYMWLTSLSKEISRTWMYHGAEHKTIACYEHGLPLTVENVKQFSRFHPRCGTSFLFLVVFLSAIVFAFFGWHSALLNLVIRLAMIPVVAGVAFEIQRLAGSKPDSFLGKIISAPGLMLQRLTTKEPDGPIIEVAIVAMTAVLPTQEGSDDWMG